MQLRLKHYLVAAAVAVASLLCVPAKASASVVRICNETGETMWLTKAYKCCFVSSTWWTVGWDRIESGSCWREDIGYGRWFFAFVTETRNPVFQPGDAARGMPFERMCVGTDVLKDFKFDRGPSSDDVGTNCPADATSVRASFGVAGGDNNVRLTLQ